MKINIWNDINICAARFQIKNNVGVVGGLFYEYLFDNSRDENIKNDLVRKSKIQKHFAARFVSLFSTLLVLAG